MLRLLDGLRAILTLIEETGGEGTRASDEDGALIAELAALNGETAVAADHEKAAPVVMMKAAGEAEEAAQSSAAQVAHAAANSDKTLRIDVDVLNRMMNLVGELVLTRNQMLQSGVEATNFPELARRLDSCDGGSARDGDAGADAAGGKSVREVSEDGAGPGADVRARGED